MGPYSAALVHLSWISLGYHLCYEVEKVVCNFRLVAAPRRISLARITDGYSAFSAAKSFAAANDVVGSAPARQRRRLLLRVPPPSHAGLL